MTDGIYRDSAQYGVIEHPWPEANRHRELVMTGGGDWPSASPASEIANQSAAWA